jgi:hypothetical protein
MDYEIIKVANLRRINCNLVIKVVAIFATEFSDELVRQLNRVFVAAGINCI